MPAQKFGEMNLMMQKVIFGTKFNNNIINIIGH